MHGSPRRSNLRLLAGPLAAVILGVGIAGLALLVPGYSQVHQTVSEIGQVGSPARVSFAALLCAVAVCLVIFAWEIRALSLEAGSSPVGAYLIACMAVSAAGVGFFAHPHPLHNVFGLSELIGYQAPLALAVAWRRNPQTGSVVMFSWFMVFLVWIAIALNLATLDRNGVVVGIRETLLWLGAASAFRNLVWMVRGGWIPFIRHPPCRSAASILVASGIPIFSSKAL